MYQSSGVSFTANGMIKKVHLDLRANDLKQRIVNDKNCLIAIFEDIFGMNGVPEEIAVSAYDLPPQPMSTVNRHDARLGGISNLSTDVNVNPMT